MSEPSVHEPLLYGASDERNLIALEHVTRKEGPDRIVLFHRDGATVTQTREPFTPFILAEGTVFTGCPIESRSEGLSGSAPINTVFSFESWQACLKAKAWLSKSTGLSPNAPGAPYIFMSDPLQQYLVSSGKTLFHGMTFEDLHRMQVDIECYTTEGYEFCNSDREGDRIIAIAMSDQSGWVDVLDGTKLDEKALLERFVAIVQERDPDVLEGHNIFNFDLPYIAARAKRHRVKLKLGRDGSTPRVRASRMSIGERTLAYQRFQIFGRHIIDTLFLAHAYDVTHRSLDGFGLKGIAVHFGCAASDRTYVDGSDIARTFREDPARLMAYVRDDATETRGVADILSRSGFLQAQMLPYPYQTVCVRGNATKIDALLVREYLRKGHALPLPDFARAFAGGYTDIFIEGVVHDVHHCDIRSLYPSLMLTHELAPRRDELGVFLIALDRLRTFRLDAKQRMLDSKSTSERMHYDALQTTFKVLINSFYGYLGFSQARFSDFDAAERVTAEGRELLHHMIDWLRQHDAQPIEIDTDGIYFVPPPFKSAEAQAEFREAFAGSLPDGIEIEFDGEYESMYSYKMKNYALLSADGEMVIKGAALKSRGLEPFQRDFLREFIRFRLQDKDTALPELKAKYAAAIEARGWPIEKFAKSEMLQDSPATYRTKREQGRPRSAAYELAIASGRDYRAGDHVSYYVTGDRKRVVVHEAAKLVSDWDPDARDENVVYYLAKLDALYAKFDGPSGQQELAL